MHITEPLTRQLTAPRLRAGVIALVSLAACERGKSTPTTGGTTIASTTGDSAPDAG